MPLRLRLPAAFVITAFVPAQQTDEGPTRADLQLHYRNVECELRAAPVPDELMQATARAHAIDLLHEYWTAGVFGCNTGFPGQRVPYFVDDCGRRCAVAFLLDRTGQEDLTLAVARAHNHAFVVDLAAETQLLQWLRANGLTLADAARIQAPPGPPPRGPADVMPPCSSPPPPPPTPPSKPEPHKPTPGNSPPPPRRPSRPSPPPPGPAAAKVPAPVQAHRGWSLEDLSESGWFAWWVWNRSALLGIDGEPAAATGRTVTDNGHSAAVALARSLLASGHADLRQASALALGRMGTDPEPLLPLLDDDARDVRLVAVLALGADRRPTAAQVLLDVATRKNDAEIASVALALSALSRDEALAQRAVGLATGRLAETNAFDGNLAAATVSAATHAPELAAGAVRLLRSDAGSLHRAAAAETLDGPVNDAGIAALTAAVGDTTTDLRQAAALGLGRSGHALALPALLTAVELEHDAGTRAVLLLAIGAHGGPAGRTMLLEQVAGGPKPLRAFAALGLALHARGRDPGADLAAVRGGAAGEHNHDLKGAWSLALGLLRDRDSHQYLIDQLHTASVPTGRAAAAEALAMLEGAAAVDELARTLANDTEPWVRTRAAAALQQLGGAAEPALQAALRGEREPWVRAQIAYEFGGVDVPAVAPTLLSMAADAQLPAAVRAGALRGLGRHFRAAGAITPRLRAGHDFTLWTPLLTWALRGDF